MMQVLTTTQQVLLKLAEDTAQVNKAAEEVLAKVNFLEEKAKGDKEAGDELLSQVKQVISKQNVIESSIQSLQQNLDTKFLLKQNQLELSFTQKKNHLEESLILRLNNLEESILKQITQVEERNLNRQNSLAADFGAIRGMLEKLCNTLPQTVPDETG